jgi:competence protein ComEC
VISIHQNPFVRICIPFIVGISISHFFELNLILIISLLLFFILFVVFSLLKTPLQNYRSRWLPGASLLFFCVLFGIFYKLHYKETKHVFLDELYTQGFQSFIVDINNDVEVKQNSVKTTVSNIGIIENSQLSPVDGKMVVYFQKDSLSEKLKYGDRIILHTRPQLPEKSLNPYSFDYRNYLLRLGISHRAWVASDKWILISENHGNVLISYALRLRNKILTILEAQLGYSDEYKVASAILTGYRASLDFDLRQLYSNAGAMHVMCVSGLHVGVIFIILSKLFSFLSDRKTAQRLIKVILILLFIWGYALLTGFSSSVLRASTMFSFVAIGGLFKRNIPIYNSLAASAVLLLLINPMALFQIGFQLSYLAVIGIVALFPFLQKMMPVKNMVLVKIRDLVAVSIAAQIMTAPISLYYFHQFPNYFILTNIIVVPLAGFIVYAAIPALLFYQIPFLGEIFGQILGFLVKSMNFSVLTIDLLPGSVSKYLYLSAFQIVLMYISLILIIVALETKRKQFVLYAFSCIVCIVGINSFQRIQNMNHKELLIPFTSSVATAISYENNLHVFAEDTSSQYKRNFEQTLTSYISRYGIKNISFFPLDTNMVTDVYFYKYPFIQFDSMRVVVWEKNWLNKWHQIEMPLIANMLILENNPFVKPEQIEHMIQVYTYVFGPTNKKQTVNIWKRIFEQYNKNYINMHESGSLRFIVN